MRNKAENQGSFVQLPLLWSPEKSASSCFGESCCVKLICQMCEIFHFYPLKNIANMHYELNVFSSSKIVKNITVKKMNSAHLELQNFEDEQC